MSTPFNTRRTTQPSRIEVVAPTRPPLLALLRMPKLRKTYSRFSISLELDHVVAPA